MPLPANWSTVTVTGQYQTIDDGTPMKGSVYFSSTVRLINGDVIVPASVKRAILDDDGAFSITLPATDDPDVDVEFYYQVDEDLTLPNGQRSGSEPYLIQLPAASPTVDLAELAPVTDVAEVSPYLRAVDLGQPGGAAAADDLDALEVSAARREQLPLRGVGGRSAVLTIVVYHTIASSAGFNTDLDYYQEWNYETVTPDQVADFIDGTGSLPDKPLLITFDDGYPSQYDNAYPGLRDRGMTATFYVTTGWLDGQVSAAEVGFTESTPMTWSQCQTMFANGMRIQTHTTDHVDQTTHTAAQAAADYLAAKARVEQMVPGETVDHMAYPYGAWDDAVKEGLETAGCRTARVVRIDTRSGAYPGANGGRLSYALLGLHHRYELPCAGTSFSDIMQANFYRSVGPDEELIPDYGFEAGGKGWSLGTGFAIDSADKHSGSRSLRCDQQTSTTTTTPSRLIPVGMFCRVVGSVWIKTVGLPPAALTKLQYQIVKPDGATIYQTIDAVAITGNNGAWTQYDWSYTGDINTGYLRIYCWLQGSTASGAGSSPTGSAWWDDLTLKRDVLPSPLALPF